MQSALRRETEGEEENADLRLERPVGTYTRRRKAGARRLAFVIERLSRVETYLYPPIVPAKARRPLLSLKMAAQLV